MNKFTASYGIVLCLLCIGLVSGCKKAPTFSMDNELDPFNENYEIGPPKNFSLQFLDRTFQADGISLRWEHPGENYIIDGFLLKLFKPEKGKFTEYKRFAPQDDDFVDYSIELPLNTLYKLFSFVEISEDSIRLSSAETVSFIQNITEFEASILNKSKVKINWEHQILNQNAAIHLERKINQQDFEMVSAFTQEKNNFTDEFEININDEISYRIFAKTDFSESDTLFSETIGYKAEKPEYLRLSSSTHSQIDLVIGHPDFADGYSIKLILPGHPRSTYTEFDIPASDADSTLIIIEDLPDTEEFILEVRTILETEHSTPHSIGVQKTPYLNYQRANYLPSSENYRPRLSADGSKLAFLNLTSNWDSYPVVWDIVNSQSIINLTQANLHWVTYDFDGNKEHIYTVDEDYIHIWDFQGNEENTLYHYANLEVIDIIAIPEKNKAALLYNGLLNIYDLQDNTLVSENAKGHYLLSSNNGEYVYVVNTFRGFYIQKHKVDDINDYSQLSTDFNPQKVLIGKNDEIILVSEEGIFIYDSSNFSLIRSINIQIDRILDANLLRDDTLAIYHGDMWNRSMDIFLLNTGQHLGGINLYEFRTENNTDFPIFEDTKVFFADSLDEIFLMSRNELTFFTLTHRWIKSTP